MFITRTMHDIGQYDNTGIRLWGGRYDCDIKQGEIIIYVFTYVSI